jgi:hypothetical protein
MTRGEDDGVPGLDAGAIDDFDDRQSSASGRVAFSLNRRTTRGLNSLDNVRANGSSITQRRIRDELNGNGRGATP